MIAKLPPRRVAIFCTVIDNFGDIGVCWRLARQLQAEHGWQVSLFVDDLRSFARICPQVMLSAPHQYISGVEVFAWSKPWQLPADFMPVDLCVEAFACEVPADFIQALNEANPAALWINLEYLTAEDWAADCHLLPSPQAGLRLAKYFFFPGFTASTGGLLREANILTQARALQSQSDLQASSWRQLGVQPPDVDSFVISLFAYSQTGIASWLRQLQTASRAVHLFIADGALANNLRQLYPDLSYQPWRQGQLTMQIMPFVAQQDYDLLLALCDLNFVRGEDSVIRAHWAGKPFIWQIYRQQDQAHLVKLNAFLALMLADSPADFRQFWLNVHLAWEQEDDFAACWPQLVTRYHEICHQTLLWQQKLIMQQDLVSNLVRFVENQHIISRNFS